MNMSAINIAGLEARRVDLTPKQIDDLETRLDGPLLRPGDEGWDDAVLMWNGMVTKAPALVIQPNVGPRRRRGRGICS